jgi:hypothetical protein
MKLLGVLIGLPIAIAVISYMGLLSLIFDFDHLEAHHGGE